jgi:hypothetical protein
MMIRLAAILGVCLLSPVWSPDAAHAFASSYRTQQTTPQNSSPQSSSNGDQSHPAQAAQAPASADQAKPAPKRHRHKAASSGNCPNTASGQTPATSNSAAASASAAPCAPKKKVVRNGGTNDPAVQLTGSPAAASSADQRAAVDQLLASAGDNLNKSAGRQLNSTQQEMVNKVHEFMLQSKTAVAAGDMERGRNLAEKARLLSEELVKP